MRVLAGPRLDLDPVGPAAGLCTRLAGADGTVVSLAALGLTNPYRPWSAAEVQVVREALRGEQGVVGYVCRGVAMAAAAESAPLRERGGDAEGPSLLDAPPAPEPSLGLCRWVVVDDHVNLTWRSPLLGRNDEESGPRFPGMAGVYVPEAALPAAERDGMIVVRGVVTGVVDDRSLSGYQKEMACRFGWVAFSSELVAPVVIAAHLGLRVAAMVMV